MQQCALPTLLPVMTVAEPGPCTRAQPPADSAMIILRLGSAGESAYPGAAIDFLLNLKLTRLSKRHSLGSSPGPALVGGRYGNTSSHLAECSVIQVRSVTFLSLQRTAVATAVLYRESPRDTRENLDNSNV